jgi:hypothetical protein
VVDSSVENMIMIYTYREGSNYGVFYTEICTIVGVLKANGSKIDRLLKDINNISLNIHRLTLHDKHLAIEERLDSGEQYIKSGGNGVTTAYYDKLLSEYKIFFFAGILIIDFVPQINE